MPKFMVTADFHLRKEIPRCRTDENWLETQRKSLQQIVKAANKRKVPVYALGDLFHTPRAATEVVSLFIEEMKTIEEGCFILAGNHDLPYHDWANVQSSSYGILRHFFKELPSFPEFDAFHFNLEPAPEKRRREIAFTHQLVFESEKARPMEECGKIPEDLLKEFPNAKWIFTGDYHHYFHFEKDGRHVVNPGCINRQAADMKDYQPQCWFIDTENEIVESIILADDENLVTDSYLRKEEERDERLEGFLEMMESKGKLTLDFRSNLETKLRNPNMEEPVKQQIIQLMEDCIK